MPEVGNVHQRRIARLSSPGEIFFTMCCHWVVLALCLGAGAALMMAKVLTDEAVYEGKATLFLNYGDSIVVEQGSHEVRGREERGRDEAQRFFNSRVEILQSDPVLRVVAKELKPGLVPDENPVQEPSSTPVSSFFAGAVRRVSTAFDASGPPSREEHHEKCQEEWKIETALLHLRDHSKVVPNSLSSTVEIYVYGPRHDVLQRELELWIEAYIDRLVEMGKETRDIFISSRFRFWEGLEKEAREALEDFKRKKPEVSKASQDLLLQELMHLQVLRLDLEAQLNIGPYLGLYTRSEYRTKDPTLEDLWEERSNLAAKLAETLPLFSENSDRVRSVKTALGAMDSILRTGAIPGATLSEENKASLREKEAKLAMAMSDAMSRYTALGVELEKLQALEDQARSAQQTRRSYELKSLEEADRAESRKNVQVQVTSRPSVSWRPFGLDPRYRVLRGALLGLGLGMILVFLWEALRGKVRCKGDVLAELDVPLIGVIPRK